MGYDPDRDQSAALHKRDDPKVAETNEVARTKMVLELLPNGPFASALDVGCGLGTTLIALRPRCSEVIGLDLHPAGKKAHPGLDIREHDLNSGSLPFPDDRFDVVVCTEVLEHLFYPIRILQEIKRVLKPEGRAVISLPNAYHIYNRRDVLLGRPVAEHSEFDSYAHHYFTSVADDIAFVKNELEVLDLRYDWIRTGVSGLVARLWRNPRLFARGVMMLCRKPA